METPLYPPQKGVEPSRRFSAHFYCGQTAACIKMPLGMQVGLSPGDCVRWGPSPPKFSAHVYYSYCDFVRTLHNALSLLVCSSSSFSILCILFLEKFNRTQSVPLCTVAPHSAGSWSRSYELVAFKIVTFVMRRKDVKCAKTANGWLWWVK